MANHRLMGMLLFLTIAVAGCGGAGLVQSPPTATAVPRPSSGAAGLVPYNDPNGAFSILIPPGWQVQQQQTNPLVKVSTLVGGPQGHIAVLQMDTRQLPAQNMDQLIAAVQVLLGSSQQAGYQEISRTNPGENWVQIESTFNRTNGRPAHSIMSLRVEHETTTSLWMVVLDQAVWDESVPAVQAILKSYKPGQSGASTPQPSPSP